MKRRRRICACGHEPHEGVCGYGAGGFFGGCTCPGTRKSRAKKGEDPAPDLAQAFELLRGTVSAAFLTFEKVIRMHVEAAPKKNATEIATSADIERVLGRRTANGADSPNVPRKGESSLLATFTKPLKFLTTDDKVAKNAAYGKQPVKLSKCERIILEVLVARKGPTVMKQLAALARYKKKGGAFQNALSSLRGKGLLHGEKGAPLQADTRAWSLVERRFVSDFWRLNKCETEILGALSITSASDSETIAEMTPSHYAPYGGAFQNGLSRLRTLGLIEGSKGQPICLTREFTENVKGPSHVVDVLLDPARPDSRGGSSQ